MIETDRLILRGWRDEDVAAHNAMTNDAGFMTFLGSPLPIAESQAAAARQQAHLATFGSCFWVVELRETGAFVGYCGIKPGPDKSPIAGLPEIGWGIASEYQRNGFAREAAAACIDWAWRMRDWPSVHAVTVPANTASWGLMERLGMARVAKGDFDHPNLPEGDPLRRHIHYRIDRPS